MTDSVSFKRFLNTNDCLYDIEIAKSIGELQFHNKRLIDIIHLHDIIYLIITIIYSNIVHRQFLLTIVRNRTRIVSFENNVCEFYNTHVQTFVTKIKET